MRRIEEDALTVDKCFDQFRASQQTLHGGKVTTKDKHELRFADSPNSTTNSTTTWQANTASTSRNKMTSTRGEASHLPFHWFVEFYGIVRNGGFDVVIGNPPYVEYSKVRKRYTILNYRTLSERRNTVRSLH